MQINGKDITMRLDLGAMKKFQELTGKNFLALGKNEMDPEMLSAMIFSFAIRGGSNVTMEDVDTLTVDELMSFQGEIEKLTGDSTKSGNPPKVSRQK